MARISSSVNTTEFELSHGKAPRGYGSWAFLLSDGPGEDETVWKHGNYGDAKAEAVKVARAQRYGQVEVLP